MINQISENELNTRINLNFARLAESSYYQINEIFSPDEYAWPADKEGRALLAFVSHYKISGRKISCMEQMLNKLPSKLNNEGYMGTVRTDVISEQQLSGHSWLLRGLCEYYEQFSDKNVLNIIKRVTEKLFLPTKGHYLSYPINRSKKENGGVSGSEIWRSNSWILSSDIGCAFMGIDGLSHVYEITKDETVKELLDEMIEVYLSIDKIKLCAQTHCTLTAARGMMRMYIITDEKKYLNGAKEIYNLYVNFGGMTYTYQNLNWWQRPDSWTEPCAVVDSLMLALDLFKVLKDETYRKTASRIYHNGFATLQRDNGGAGTDSLVTYRSPCDCLKVRMYEAFFCCTMRLAEGLWYVKENAPLLYAETTGTIKKNKNGIYCDEDIIYCLPSESLLPYADKTVDVDGMKLVPLVKYYMVPKQVIENAQQKIIFTNK